MLLRGICGQRGFQSSALFFKFTGNPSMVAVIPRKPLITDVILPNKPMNKFKTVASFRDLPLAELAKTKLESEGVYSFLLNKHHIGVNWLYSQVLGGVKVQVDANDFDIAQKILNTDESDYLNQSCLNFPKANDNDLCDHCHSSNLEHIKYSRLSGAIMLLGIPLLFWGNRLKCKDCGHKMKRKT